MIDTVPDLIDELGGNRAVADLLGVVPSAVRNWRARGLPAWACGRLRDALDPRVQYDPALFAIKPRGRSEAA